LEKLIKEEHERPDENAYQERQRVDLERERYQQIIQTLLAKDFAVMEKPQQSCNNATS
jgi:hypothetical protein